MRARLLAILACAACLAGCSTLQGMATRYRAERMVWDAQKAVLEWLLKG